MNAFEMKTLNAALLNVESADDARALAAIVMKLTKIPYETEDHVLDKLEHYVLAVLIDLERRREEPRFENICLFIRSENSQPEPKDIELEEPVSKRLQKFALFSLESRLAPFRALRAA